MSVYQKREGTTKLHQEAVTQLNFGTRVKQLREERSMTRHYLAKKLGVSYSAIGHYENNKRFPDQDTLIKIADVFNICLDCLFGRTFVASSKLDNPEDLGNKILAQIKAVNQKGQVFDVQDIETDKAHEKFKTERAKWRKAKDDLEHANLQLRKLITVYAAATKETA